MRLFDVYIAVDWSSKTIVGPAKPTKDSLWVGERIASPAPGETASQETYWRTRAQCFNYLRERLLHHKDLGRRVLIGCDFAYGYPAGYAKALGLNGTPWLSIWNELTHLIQDDENNMNNRFDVAAELNSRCCTEIPGPLWGRPNAREWKTLSLTSPRYPYVTRGGARIEKFRWVDRGEKGIQPIWKLIGTGSVGGQCLVGIPVVNKLRHDKELSSVSKVWPFETGFTRTPLGSGPTILHVEIWPGLVPTPLDPLPIKDQAQVRTTAAWFHQLDAAGKLGALFDRPSGLTEQALKDCVNEEGWILGGGHRRMGQRQLL